jgi:hypothetical protein
LRVRISLSLSSIVISLSSQVHSRIQHFSEFLYSLPPVDLSLSQHFYRDFELISNRFRKFRIQSFRFQETDPFFNRSVSSIQYMDK